MIRFLGLSLGLALVVALQLGGTGGCGAAGGDGGDGDTPAGSSAVSAGGATATSRAVTSALTSALAGVGGGAGLTVKLTEEGDSEDLACTCDDVTGDCACEDDAAESEGDVGCNFDDLPGEDDFGLCDDGLSISGDFAFSGTVTFDNAVFDECGQEITLDGTVSFSGSITLDCDGNITGTIRIFTEEACSGITGVDGDGTTHDIGMDVTMDEAGDVTGSVCVDGDEIDATEVETACDEASSGGLGPFGCEEGSEGGGTGDVCVYDCTSAGNDITDCKDRCAENCACIDVGVLGECASNVYECITDGAEPEVCAADSRNMDDADNFQYCRDNCNQCILTCMVDDPGVDYLSCLDDCQDEGLCCEGEWSCLEGSCEDNSDCQSLSAATDLTFICIMGCCHQPF